MRNKILSELIDKYLNGESTHEEETQLLHWYNSAQQTDSDFNRLTEAEMKALKLKMLNRIRRNTYKKTPVFYMRKAFYYYGAAVLLAAILIGINLSQPAKLNFKAATTSAKAPTVYFTNKSNKMSRHLLPDRSLVWLKPNSTISYNQPFVKDFRKISLTGEAFFEVAKDSEHPFLISAGDVITRVVGTSFNVKANKNASITEVDVVTGKVLVYTPITSNRKAKGVYLLPKQKVTYSKINHQLIRYESKEPALKIWQKNTLSFDNTPLEDVVVKLNHVFDANISISDQRMKTYTLKADFTDVNLMTIMELLSKSLNLTYEIQGDTLILSEETKTNI